MPATTFKRYLFDKIHLKAKFIGILATCPSDQNQRWVYHSVDFLLKQCFSL